MTPYLKRTLLIGAGLVAILVAVAFATIALMSPWQNTIPRNVVFPLDCGTTRMSIGDAAMELPSPASAATSAATEQDFARDPTLICEGDNILATCVSSTAEVRTDAFGVLTLITLNTGDKCQTQITATSDNWHQSITCPVTYIEAYILHDYSRLGEHATSAFGLFDHNKPGAYAGDIIRTLFSLLRTYAPATTGCVTEPPQHQI